MQILQGHAREALHNWGILKAPQAEDSNSLLSKVGDVVR